MPKQENVPTAKVGRVVQNYVDGEECAKVTAVKQDDGTWTVTAVKPK